MRSIIYCLLLSGFITGSAFAAESGDIMAATSDGD